MKKSSPASTTAAPKPVFTGGDQGFVSLKLEQIEKLNHNTKKFRFSLGDDNAVSGMHVACKDDRMGTDVVFGERLLMSDSCACDEVSGSRNGEAGYTAVYAGLG